MKAGDTIAAISTPPGRGGIGVVRVSGPSAITIARGLFRVIGSAKPDSEPPPVNFEPNHAVVGHVFDIESGEALDTAVLTFFKAPRSYTGEDVVEISCHGSPVILARLVEQTLALGARLAEPGEFTMRAFLNRRIDLAQAQAVRDLIEAQTAFQAQLATRQLDGALSRRIAPLKETLLDVIVQLESSLEFVEDDISPENATGLMNSLTQITPGLSRVESSFALGRYVREGFDLAIVGRPNVGKSSIFNRLIGADRAIVTDVPGTTRDALRESTSIRGIPVRLIDTAGIRETTDVVEVIGINRTREAIADADIQLLVLDASEPLTPDDRNLLAQTPASSRVILINKTDLPQHLDQALLNTARPDQASSDSLDGMIRISAATGAGFDCLADYILGKLGGGDSALRDDLIITDARQHQAIRSAIAALAGARDLMEHHELEEIVLLKLRAGLEALGEITGETLNDDILAQIFSTFCIGK